MAQNAMATKAEESSDAVHPERMHEGVQYAPRVDILETENEISIYADMPGCKPEDVDVEFDNGQLELFGKCTPRQDNVHYLLREYGVGNYHRTFTISESIDVAGLSASYKQGVVIVRLPKSEASKPKRIPVQAE